MKNSPVMPLGFFTAVVTMVAIPAWGIHVPRSSANITTRVHGGTACTRSDVFIGTFNIQNFGKTKASRPAVLTALGQIIARYDMVAIQELSQMPDGSSVCGPNTESAICDLLAAARTVSKRDLVVAASPRIGDEQYALVYDSARFTLSGGDEYPDPHHAHSRPPYIFHMELGGADSLAVGITHTSPGNASREIYNFPNVTKWMEASFESTFNLLVGDFNADGGYFPEDTWPEVLKQMPRYKMLTPNDLDTTVASSSRTYDRILASKTLQANDPVVYRIDKQMDLEAVLKEGCAEGYVPRSVCEAQPTPWAEVAKELSDHYPVEVCVRPTSPRQ